MNPIHILPADLTGHQLIALLWRNRIPAIAELAPDPWASTRRTVCRDFGVAWVDLRQEPVERTLRRLAAGITKMPVAILTDDPSRIRRQLGTHPTLMRAPLHSGSL